METEYHKLVPGQGTNNATKHWAITGRAGQWSHHHHYHNFNACPPASLNGGDIALNGSSSCHACRWRKQAVEEQQRFKQAAEAYKARIQQLQTRVGSLQADLEQQRRASHPAPTPNLNPHSPLQHPPQDRPVGEPQPAGSASSPQHAPAAHPPPTHPVGAVEAPQQDHPAGQSSPHSLSGPAASPRTSPGSQTGVAAAPTGVQQHDGEECGLPIRQAQGAAAGLQEAPNAVDPRPNIRCTGQQLSRRSPESCLATATLQGVGTRGDEVTSRELIRDAEAAVEGGCAAGVDMAIQGITPQLLAHALAQAFATMPSGGSIRAICSALLT